MLHPDHYFLHVDSQAGIHFLISSAPLAAQASTTRLNCLNLSLCPRQPLEALGELRPVEVKSLASLNRSQGSAGVTANMATDNVGVLTPLIEGTVLLRFLAIAGKRLRKLVGWRCRVCVGSVIDPWGIG